MIEPKGGQLERSSDYLANASAATVGKTVVWDEVNAKIEHITGGEHSTA
jgi:hypothetical protein